MWSCTFDSTALILKLKLFLLNKREEKDFKLCKFYNRKADHRVLSFAGKKFFQNKAKISV